MANIEELKDHYQDIESNYQAVCDECAVLNEKIEAKRKQAQVLLDEMNEMLAQIMDEYQK